MIRRRQKRWTKSYFVNYEADKYDEGHNERTTFLKLCELNKNVLENVKIVIEFVEFFAKTLIF